MSVHQAYSWGLVVIQLYISHYIHVKTDYHIIIQTDFNFRVETVNWVAYDLIITTLRQKSLVVSEA